MHAPTGSPAHDAGEASRRHRSLLLARDWSVVVGVGLVALLVLTEIGQDVFARETSGFDNAVRAWIIAHQHPAAASFFYWVSKIGSVGPMEICALLAATYLWYRGRRYGAASVLVAPVFAVTAYELMKKAYGRSRPAGLGRVFESDPSFPSGHSTATVAVCCTVAYVFVQEGLVRRGPAIALAIGVPLLVGFSRVYLDVHWATDVLGGWSGGLLIAAMSWALYRRYQSART